MQGAAGLMVGVHGESLGAPIKGGALDGRCNRACLSHLVPILGIRGNGALGTN